MLLINEMHPTWYLPVHFTSSFLHNNHWLRNKFFNFEFLVSISLYLLAGFSPFFPFCLSHLFSDLAILNNVKSINKKALQSVVLFIYLCYSLCVYLLLHNLSMDYIEQNSWFLNVLIVNSYLDYLLDSNSWILLLTKIVL